jgi:hypothetical protein
MSETYWQAQQRYHSTSSSEGNSSSDLPVNSRARRTVAGDENKVYKYAPDIQEVAQEAQKPQKVAEGRPYVHAWTETSLEQMESPSGDLSSSPTARSDIAGC